MSIMTVAELKAYAKKLDSDTTGEALYQIYIDAAERIVSDYLTYSPSTASYSHTFYGDGKCYLQLKAKPVTALTSVTVDGVARTVGDFTLDAELLVEKNGVEFPADSVIVVAYTAGYTVIPGIIKLTILEIAALLAMEAGENIGVTSQTFDGGNTRNFLNYTRFDKYLEKLFSDRIIRLPRSSP